MNVAAASLSRNKPPLDRRRVYILPSRYGVILGFLLFAILLGSINYDNALGYILTFLIGGLYLVGMLHTYRNVLGLASNHLSAENGFAGERIPFHVDIENTSSIDKLNLTLTALGPPSRWLKRRRTIAHNGAAIITSGSKKTCTLSIKTNERGQLRLPRIKVSTNFPLGIFLAWGYFPHEAKCLIYPKPEGQLPLPAASFAPGNEQTPSGKGDADFHGLREYSGGEPLKHIAWRALAKYDRLMVKQFSGDSDTQLILHWRHTASLNDTEVRLSQLCLWVLQASQAQLAFGLQLPNESIAVASGEAHRLRCLRALAEY